jgi:aldehyde:ferredoxin oxidoreductase
MGSKHLKAIAVEGTRQVGIADRRGLRAVNEKLIERSHGPMTAKYRLLGIADPNAVIRAARLCDRLGLDSIGADDTLPARCFDEALPDGPGAGERLSREDLDIMLDGYYAARGWNTDGLPADRTGR